MTNTFIILATILATFWLTCNLLVIVKYKPIEMAQDLWQEQNIIGKITANLFYLPAWLIKIIWYSWRYLWKNYISKGLVWLIFAILRMLQDMYHSVIDIT